MRFRNPACDGEAQPNASKLARPGFVGTVEAIKNARQIGRADTNASIPELHQGGMIGALNPDSNSPLTYIDNGGGQILVGDVKYGGDSDAHPIKLALEFAIDQRTQRTQGVAQSVGGNRLVDHQMRSGTESSG